MGAPLSNHRVSTVRFWDRTYTVAHMGLAEGSALAGGRFQLLSELGAGGMGRVFEALDTELGTRVALKQLHHLTPTSLLRFKNEFRTLQDLQHPNLVQLGELFEDNGSWFFTMELVDGVDFLAWVRGSVRSRTTRPPALRHADTITIIDGQVQGLPSVLPRRSDAPAGDADVARLRPALAQLVTGVLALHRAGLVHRDLKPSNVLITHEGRVVVLDFGLVQSLDATPTRESIEGTAIYMSPEQAASQTLGPASDWYSIGVMLYELLVGKPPFDGPLLAVLASKAQHEPGPPSISNPGVPRDLDILCARLLALQPQDRPTDRELAALLEIDAEPSGLQGIPVPVSRAPFVGRTQQLGQLEEELAQVRSTNLPTVVLVEGSSGVGKTALVRHFADQARAAHRALIFVGRCSEREYIPYKSFDGVIDGLARHLSRLAPAEVAALLPADARLLPQVFPVLRGVAHIAKQADVSSTPGDPLELRSRVFAALRQILGTISAQVPLIVVVDDLQWADRDSLALARSLLDGAEAPALLLLATLRTMPERQDPRILPFDGKTRMLLLDPLPGEDAEELAQALLGRVGTAQAASVAHEARGHPWLVTELCHHIVALGGQVPANLRVDDTVRLRLEHLDALADELLQLVCVAAGPISQDSLALAAGLASATAARELAHLRAAHLVSASGVHRRSLIEPIHDRVREAVMARIEPERLRSLHERLALALEVQGAAEPQALYLHWLAAGAREKAAGYAILGAERAESALAFDRAAALFKQALDLGALPAEATERARARKAEALASAGQPREAADEFLALARDQSGELAFQTRRRALEQLFRCGELDVAFSEVDALLSPFGLRVPSTPARRRARWLWARWLNRLLGRRFRPARPGGRGSKDLIDLLATLATSLTHVNPALSAVYQEIHLHRARRLGDPARFRRALEMEVATLSVPGPVAEAAIRRIQGTLRLLPAHAPLAIDSAAPLVAGIAASFYFSDFKASAAASVELERRCLSGEVVVGRDLSSTALLSVRLWGLWSQYYLGNLGDLAHRIPVLHREAQERQDCLAAMAYRLGVLSGTLLAADLPDRALRIITRVAQPWAHQRRFTLATYLEWLARSQLELYLGQAEAAHHRTRQIWPALLRSDLLRLQLVRVEALHLRGRILLGLAETAVAPKRNESLTQVEQLARRIKHERTPMAHAMAALLRAGISGAARNPGAERDLEAAVSACGNAELGLFLHAARFQLARTRGQAGKALRSEAAAWLLDQRVVHPARMVHLLVPGFEHSSARVVTASFSRP